MSEGNRKVSDLREGEDNVSIKVRVLSVDEPKVIHTKRGDRTISEAIVGDESGRIKLTMWGNQAGKINEGDAIELKGAWTTSFKGDVQLNIGSRGEINKIDEGSLPKPEDIPENTPKASESSSRSYGRSRGGYRRGGYGGRGYRRDRGGYSSSFGSSEEGEESSDSEDEE
ncbi:OB-fold nucleic acid binding protein [Caldisphaera lagunensis DSM 15908]|uniref:OB-fold nucleic acid binding protein n=1 Tax=Caldisphaera lagunensis (strain DSM 15908 / JCM 11604 / ANMR 0165 / IC-154) TaxID=1056495 RepID=L0AAA3_CALLD|nr:OB-fold nucleic acid binding protein [Caldisphaera lagunensis DSM 15908]